MKFLVHLVAERGKAKSVIVNAADIKDAEN